MANEHDVHNKEHIETNEAHHEHGHAHTHNSDEHDELKRQLETQRRLKDKFLLEHPQSPLLPEDKEHFAGANYFPVNLAYKVVATFVPEEHPGIFKVQTSTGDQKEYTRAGRLHFEIDGEKLSLVAFVPPADEPLHGNRLFVPFRDQTSSKETYGAGRYLDLNKRPGDQYVVDFNRAYNPYCAYSPYYSCPIPPGENTLAVEIRAGEKSFHD
ncbi:MAG TPA: DUF1684 domain-containing protein [Chloroflexia bacterium]|nr:DUF1684 domain-containing protein [Chloroflexia bacterium]